MSTGNIITPMSFKFYGKTLVRTPGFVSVVQCGSRDKLFLLETEYEVDFRAM